MEEVRNYSKNNKHVHKCFYSELGIRIYKGYVLSRINITPKSSHHGYCLGPKTVSLSKTLCG